MRTRRFRFLDEALEVASVDDTIAIIPPDGSDEEEIDDEADSETQEVEEVAGSLEIIPAADEDANPVCPTPKIWSRKSKLKPMPERVRLATLFEKFPFLENLTPLQYFKLFFSREVMELMVEESVRYTRHAVYCFSS